MNYDKCPQCGNTELRLFTNVTISFSAKRWGRIPIYLKKTFRETDVQVHSSDYNHLVACHQCGWNESRFRNAHDALYKENLALLAQIERLKEQMDNPVVYEDLIEENIKLKDELNSLCNDSARGKWLW